MKVVCHELAQAIVDPEGSTMDDIVVDADRLVSCRANKTIIMLFLTYHFSIVSMRSSQLLSFLAGCEEF